LRHVAEAFSPARQGTILNPHRVIGIPLVITYKPTILLFIILIKNQQLAIYLLQTNKTFVTNQQNICYKPTLLSAHWL